MRILRELNSQSTFGAFLLDKIGLKYPMQKVSRFFRPDVGALLFFTSAAIEILYWIIPFEKIGEVFFGFSREIKRFFENYNDPSIYTSIGILQDVTGLLGLLVFLAHQRRRVSAFVFTIAMIFVFSEQYLYTYVHILQIGKAFLIKVYNLEYFYYIDAFWGMVSNGLIIYAMYRFTSEYSFGEVCRYWKITGFIFIGLIFLQVPSVIMHVIFWDSLESIANPLTFLSNLYFHLHYIFLLFFVIAAAATVEALINLKNTNKVKAQPS